MITTSQLFLKWICGWSDGAGSRPMDDRCSDDPNPDLSIAYHDGYSEGTKARSAAHLNAVRKYGGKVSRAQDKQGKPLWQVFSEEEAKRAVKTTPLDP